MDFNDDPTADDTEDVAAAPPQERPPRDALMVMIATQEHRTADFLVVLEEALTVIDHAHPSMRRYIERARDDFERGFMALERAVGNRRNTLGSRCRR